MDILIIFSFVYFIYLDLLLLLLLYKKIMPVTGILEIPLTWQARMRGRYPAPAGHITDAELG